MENRWREGEKVVLDGASASDCQGPLNSQAARSETDKGS